MNLECIECGKKHDLSTVVNTCSCDGLLEIRYDLSEVDFSLKDRTAVPPHVWKYRELLPISGVPVSLMEGGTPLYRCKRLEAECGLKELYVKHEGMNPTGSFKDRGMTVGVSRAAELGMKILACASTGNTSASMAIYAAKGFYLLNSVNPYRLEGQKTIAFETIDQLAAYENGNVPDRVIVPVGNAGNISAIYKGFKEFRELDIINNVPMMTGIQASRSAPIVDAFSRGLSQIEPLADPQTVATAIRIGNPINAPKALRSIRQSNGVAESVTDQEILKAQKDLARLEGIGVEPASAASLAGLRKLIAQGTVDRDEVVVCVTTGHLLKDPESIMKACHPPIEVDANFDALYATISELERS